MAADGFERILCVKNEVFVYKIPARTTNRGYRAADWTLDAPDWTGRLRAVNKNDELWIKLEDKSSGELFAQGIIDKFPSICIEQVTDSSRYFVFRILDPNGRSAFIGMGFSDRADSFDLLVTIQDHFKMLNRDVEAEKAATFDAGPKLDLGFKEGQTIHINIGAKKEGISKARPRAAGSAGFLPPPPGGSARLAGPPRPGQSAASPLASPSGSSPFQSPSPAQPPKSNSGSDLDFLDDFGAPAAPAAPQPAIPPPANNDPWGNFTSAGSTQASVPPADSNSGGSGWVTF